MGLLHLTINFNKYFMIICLLCNSQELLRGEIKYTTIIKIRPLVESDFPLKGLWVWMQDYDLSDAELSSTLNGV